MSRGASRVILPKVRDPRFVTIRRGGTLTDSDIKEGDVIETYELVEKERV